MEKHLYAHSDFPQSLGASAINREEGRASNAATYWAEVLPWARISPRSRALQSIATLVGDEQKQNKSQLLPEPLKP